MNASIFVFSLWTRFRLILLSLGFLWLLIFGAWLFRSHEMNNPDVALLLSIAEMFVQGKNIYVDYWEINPPGAFLIYVPAVYLASWLHINAETALYVLTIGCGLLSLRVCLSFMHQADMAVDSSLRSVHPFALFLLGFILFVMPAEGFGQREHIGTLGLLPFLVWAGLGGPHVLAHVTSSVLAGALLTLSLMAKPHMVLAVMLVSLWWWMKIGTWSAVFVLLRTALIRTLLLGLVLYLGYSLWAFPAFFHHVMLMALDLYAPIRMDIFKMLIFPPTFLMVMLIYLHRESLSGCSCSHAFVAAAIAMLVAYLGQGKGWPYQSYPAVALILLAILLAQRSESHQRLPMGGYLPLALVVVVGVFWFNSLRDVSQERTAAIADLLRSQSGPLSVAAVNEDSGVLYPMMRHIKGELAQTSALPWVLGGSLIQSSLPEQDMAPSRFLRLKIYEHEGLRQLKYDLSVRKPRFLLLQKGWLLSWIQTQPVLSVELEAYEPIATVKDITVMKRKSVSP